jgi:predicted metal-dependent phosphoesterase TrpH
MPANPDLHCHSIVSDGLLTPATLVERAKTNGVDLLALTDHDEIGGLDEAAITAEASGLRFVTGVEISVSWGDDQTVHVVGLNFDHRHPDLVAGLARVRSGRDARAGRMAVELAKVGIDGAYEGALKYVGNPALISRSHFARYIVERGFAPDVKTVFDHWLAKDKPGYVSHSWAELTEAVDWIRAAGGIAVIAHPGRYRLTGAERRALYVAFKERGGQGIEVVSGSSNEAEIREFAGIAREFGFLASRASDFHGPGESWIDLGRMVQLPSDLKPVWADWH